MPRAVDDDMPDLLGPKACLSLSGPPLAPPVAGPIDVAEMDADSYLRQVQYERQQLTSDRMVMPDGASPPATRARRQQPAATSAQAGPLSGAGSASASSAAPAPARGGGGSSVSELMQRISQMQAQTTLNMERDVGWCVGCQPDAFNSAPEWGSALRQDLARDDAEGATNAVKSLFLFFARVPQTVP